jgi:osmotically-inducible protein OsmY
MQSPLEITHCEVAPDVVRHAIEAALMRHVKRAAQHVCIEVCGGCVRLSGGVPSWVERQAVVGAAMGTPGVLAVEDRLNIHVVA